jgi:hypothetical protein
MKEKILSSYCLNAGQKPPPCSSKNGIHVWVEISKPDNYQSGWHEDKCSVCGVIVTYDTSD